MDSDSFIFLVGIIAVAVIAFFIGAAWGDLVGEKDGYTKALQDMKKGNPPAYVLVEQPDGTTEWEGNKEKGK